MAYFVDSSVIVAVLSGEEDGETWAALIEAGSDKSTSPVAIYEATLALCRKFRISTEQAQSILVEFLHRSGIAVVDIPATAYEGALSAHAQYGKGTGSPAQLNLGDCFSYAMAKLLGSNLLYKGDDFAHTDLA